MNTRARKRILLALFLSLAVLIGLPVWLTWREVQQERLNRDLIVAIKQNNMAKAVALLNAGADANTKDSGNTLVSTRQVLRDWWDRLRGRKATATAFCPSALIVATHGNYMQSVTHPVVEPLPANPALFHYTQTIIHQGFVIIPPENPALIKALLDHGADPNVRNGTGDTALIIAANHDHTATARILLAKGADINAKDKDGLTALSFAEENGHQDCVRLLKQHGARK